VPAQKTNEETRVAAQHVDPTTHVGSLPSPRPTFIAMIFALGAVARGQSMKWSAMRGPRAASCHRHRGSRGRAGIDIVDDGRTEQAEFITYITAARQASNVQITLLEQAPMGRLARGGQTSPISYKRIAPFPTRHTPFVQQPVAYRGEKQSLLSANLKAGA